MYARSATEGLTLVEILVAFAIFLTLFLPAHTLYLQSRGAVFRSKLALQATMAARDEAEDLRMLARVAGDRIPDLAHPWQPVTIVTNAMDRLAGKHPAARDRAIARPAAHATLDYPESYARIWTRLEIGPSPDGLAYPATLHVLWQQHGETIGEADPGKRNALSSFTFVLVRPS